MKDLVSAVFERRLLRNILTTLALVAGGIIGTKKGLSVLFDPKESHISQFMYLIAGVAYVCCFIMLIVRFWTVDPVKTDGGSETTKPQRQKLRDPFSDPIYCYRVESEARRVLATHL